MKKFFFSIIAFLFLFNSGFVFAADLNVDCYLSGCIKSLSTPLFSLSADGYWYPGRQLAKSMLLTNHTTFPLNISLEAPRSGSASILENVFNAKLTGVSTIYDGNLTDFYQTSSFNLGILGSGSTAVYSLAFTFDPTAGNTYQNRTSVFDLNLNFSEDISNVTPTPEPTSTPTPTPTASPTPTPTPFLNPASGIYLNEIMPETSTEWVELYNSNNFPVILENWQLDDIASGGCSPKTLGVSITIPALSYYTYDYADNCFNNNTTDSVRLINNLGSQVDIFTYNYTSSSYSWSKQSGGNWCLANPTKNFTNDPCVYSPTNAPGPNPPGAPVCNDSEPGIPSLLSANQLANGDVVLTWTRSNNTDYYVIAYGPSSGNYLYGNPHVGDSNSTSYTVGSLTPQARYCFYVRGQHGCMPGARSNEICVNPGSAVVPANIIPSGFQPSVLGSTDLTPTPAPQSGESLGTNTATCRGFWLPLLFILAFAINSFMVVRTKRFVRLFGPLLISLIAYIVDFYFLSRYCCGISFLCRFYGLGCLLAFVIPVLFFPSQKS